MDDEGDFKTHGKQLLDKYRHADEASVTVDAQGMMSISKDLLKTSNDDDIKPVIVTDISQEQLQEILAAQKEGDINKVRKRKMKEAKKEKKESKKKAAQWVQIDNEGNKVKAIVGKSPNISIF